MRTRTFSLLLLGVTWLVVPDSVRAEGLINNLPEDGSWVVFRAKSELDLQGNLQSFERELRMSSVGKQEVEGSPARWIELSTEFTGRKVVAKLLIEEKHLKPDVNPFQHVVKAWARNQDGEAVELPENRLRQMMIFALGVPHFDKPEKKERAKIKTELGEYECDQLAGTVELDGPMDTKVKIGGDIWVHEKVPFGLVKAKIKGELGFGNIETEMELIQAGKDAKSELPDAK